MNFDNAFEKDSRVAIRIQTPMPDFDNKVGGLNPAGMDVGGITDKVDAVKEKMLNDFLEPLMDAGLIILRGKSHDTASFIVKNPADQEKIVQTAQTIGFLLNDAGKKAAQQRIQQTQQAAQVMPQEFAQQAFQQLGIEPPKQQQGGGNPLAAMMGGGGMPQQQPQQQQRPEVGMPGKGMQPRPQQADAPTQRMRNLQKLMVSGGLKPTDKPSKSKLGLISDPKIARYVITAIFNGNPTTDGERIHKDMRNRFRLMAGGIDNSAGDGTFSLNFSTRDESRANEILNYIKTKFKDNLEMVLTNREDLEIASQKKQGLDPTTGKPLGQQQQGGGMMGGMMPGMGIGGMSEERALPLRLNPRVDGSEEEGDAAPPPPTSNPLMTSNVNTPGGFEQPDFDFEGLFCQLFPQLCDGGEIDVEGDGTETDPDGPADGDDDIPDADTPGLYPAMTGNPNQKRRGERNL